MQRDIGDIIDRFTISWLKKDRIGSSDNLKEYEAFKKEVDLLPKNYPEYDWNQIIKFIYDINDFIWQLESGLKSGKEELPDKHYIFSEKNNEVKRKIADIAILNRNFNNLRVSFKNIINKLTKTGFMDEKKDHI